MNYDRFGPWDEDRLNYVRGIVETLSTTQTKVEKILEDILDEYDERIDTIFDYAWNAIMIVTTELHNASLKEGEEDKREEIAEDLLEFKDKTPMDNLYFDLMRIIQFSNRRAFNYANSEKWREDNK